ncbi:Ldh family oxidoreductase [Salinarimonas rosea]|uniref:Ldh family oxidoreductase n=1 Tax=Salinarimonas rosea TaxID=552063 RepID=UPI0005BBE652|nr:Ldh family oxidoreductase [Salinarimonas rosea]
MVELLCPPSVLVEHCSAILRHNGLPPDHARTVAESLVHANLRGVDSHGVSRLPIYVERLQLGLVERNPDVRVIEDRGAILLLDGGNGMGHVVTAHAVDLALERLQAHGTVSVGIRNSNHYASGAYYVERAAARDAIAFLYGNAPPTMAAWGGVDPYLGTNPYTFAVPTGRHAPIVLDMATSVVARGKIIQAAARGVSIPQGWANDALGRPTTDAEAALDGSVLPFGGPKGYGIALMIDIMAGVLTGAGFGPRVGDLYRELGRPQECGAFLQLTHSGAFQPVSTFKERIDAMIEEIKSGQRASGVEEILVPGEIEARTAARRKCAGIPMPSTLLDELDGIGAPAGVSLRQALPGDGRTATGISA